MENRVFHFGKYKGEEIKYVILTDIGYIAWCLNNISSFLLNDEEWVIYDAIAIMFKKYGVEPPIKEEVMYRYVKDKEKLKNLDTPFVYKHGYITTGRGRNDSVCKIIDKYKVSNSTNQGTGWELLCEMGRMIEKDMLAEEEASFCGWGTMNDYKD